jgi:Na+(H+)/acetate symporter ActP
MELSQARAATIAVIPVAIYFASTMDALSVFRIFLFADLLAAATVAPVLLALWPVVSSRGALIGAVAGLTSVVVYGAVTSDLSTGLNYLWSPTNEYGLANLGVFLSALIGSAVVTVAGSYALPNE